MSHSLTTTQRCTLFLLPLALIFTTGCHHSAVPGDPSSQLPVAPVEYPVRAPLSKQLEVAGELIPYQEVELHAKVSGYIKHIYVDIGDHVRKGQVLAVLEIPELRAQVEGAKAGVLRSQQDVLRARSAVARAKADYVALHAAYQRLKQAAEVRPGLIAQQELDDAQAKDTASAAQVDVARAGLAASQQALSVAKDEYLHYESLADYARITAPYSGVVAWRYSDTGALVQAGTSSSAAQPVVKLDQTDVLRLRLPVPEALAGYVRVGDSAQIHVAATGQQLTGKVVRTTGSLDMTTRTLQVEIDLKNPGNKLLPGMYADVNLNIGRSGTGLTLPIQAVNQTAAQPFAYVVNAQGRIKKHVLRLGNQTPSRVEVISGIADGDKVVAANLSSYTPGEAVRPQQVTLPTFNADGAKGGE